MIQFCFLKFLGSGFWNIHTGRKPMNAHKTSFFPLSLDISANYVHLEGRKCCISLFSFKHLKILTFGTYINIISQTFIS